MGVIIILVIKLDRILSEMKDWIIKLRVSRYLIDIHIPQNYTRVKIWLKWFLVF